MQRLNQPILSYVNLFLDSRSRDSFRKTSKSLGQTIPNTEYECRVAVEKNERQNLEKRWKLLFKSILEIAEMFQKKMPEELGSKQELADKLKKIQKIDELKFEFVEFNSYKAKIEIILNAILVPFYKFLKRQEKQSRELFLLKKPHVIPECILLFLRFNKSFNVAILKLEVAYQATLHEMNSLLDFFQSSLDSTLRHWVENYPQVDESEENLIKRAEFKKTISDLVAQGAKPDYSMFCRATNRPELACLLIDLGVERTKLNFIAAAELCPQALEKFIDKGVRFAFDVALFLKVWRNEKSLKILVQKLKPTQAEVDAIWIYAVSAFKDKQLIKIVLSNFPMPSAEKGAMILIRSIANFFSTPVHPLDFCQFLLENGFDRYIHQIVTIQILTGLCLDVGLPQELLNKSELQTALLGDDTTDKVSLTPLMFAAIKFSDQFLELFCRSASHPRFQRLAFNCALSIYSHYVNLYIKDHFLNDGKRFGPYEHITYNKVLTGFCRSEKVLKGIGEEKDLDKLPREAELRIQMRQMKFL